MNVVLDLDGTIIFAEPTSIAIRGRSRASYLSSIVANRLKQISHHGSLYVATARNAVTVASLVRALPDVPFAGFVLESGLVTRSTVLGQVGECCRSRASLSAHLAEELPEWELVVGYEKAICCVAPAGVNSPKSVVKRILSAHPDGDRWSLHQERHKTFLYPEPICKLRGLRRLGVDRIDFSAGDDAVYDRAMLESSAYPLTLADADAEILHLVNDRGGFISHSVGHAGAEEILDEILRKLSSTNR